MTIKTPIQKADGSPTKDFFVGMLTRDIDLNDAILDLLDNCLDGVVRKKDLSNRWNDLSYYSGFTANITIKSNSFIIEDNCGGIPKETAIKYAFKMGRSKEAASDDLPTVGIYGIGMKRAIFKMGQEAYVHTKNENEKYSVHIPKNWAANDSDWDFPILNDIASNDLESTGTKIVITNLNSGISILWDNDDKIKIFCENLKNRIKESYSLIIQKGFNITINGQKVEPKPFSVLVSKSGYKPYIYKDQIDSIKINLVIGFYSPPPTDTELEEIMENKRRSTEAGVTIVCNDRVVLYNDKTHLTGWGSSGVPSYHTQFIGISGLVTFESIHPGKLPMTTTKRGVDLASPIYHQVLQKIIDGLKIFTNFTNKWKGQNVAERAYSLNAKPLTIQEIFNANLMEEQYQIKINSANKSTFTYKPDLPKPNSNKPFRVIRYTKSNEEINTVAKFFNLVIDTDATPSNIGEKCFDFVLNKN